MELLMDYSWPGNVRELANAVERVVLISANRDEIEVGDFPQGMQCVPAVVEQGPARPPREHAAALSQMEWEYVHSVLHSVGGNKSKAARILGISRRTLYRAIGKPA
jgi:transcriptional regulator with PAS, ATPase and Fis domain